MMMSKMKSDIIKRCSDCRRFLSEDDFGWLNKKKGYKKSCCKRCALNRNYLWDLDNSEYFEQHYQENKEHKKKYYQDNKEQILERNKQYQKDNKEYIAERDKKYRKDNKEQILKRNKQYRKNNPDKINAKTAKRRVAKKNQTVPLTDIEKDRVKFIYKIVSTMADYVIDHIQPISKGGSDHPANLQILHKNLNSEKHNKWPLTEEEETKYRGFRL